MGESTSPALLAAQTCHVDCRQRVFSTTPSERLKTALGDDVKHILVSTKPGELQFNGNRDEVEDAEQEIFLALYRDLSGFRRQSAFST